MKVLFVTDAGDETGIGGHLYSVQALVAALSPRIECVVVSVGGAACPALEALACRRHRLAFGAGRLRRAERARFLEIVRAEKPDVIHAFDPIAGAFARAAARRCGCGVVFTKCGGPNPAGRWPYSYYPRVERLVLFSEENERYFRTRRRFRRTRIWRIPNRIQEGTTDAAKVAALRARLDPARPVVLRIGRISTSYARTAEQCVRLARRLAADGVPAQLVFLGAVQDPAVARALLADLGGQGIVVSDPELVAQAAALLDVGDLVVGTGRGLMEAAARGRVLLAPVRNGLLPALVTEANWEPLFAANFSERCELVPWDEERNYAEIRRALADPECRRRRSAFARRLYEEQFALDPVVDRYLEIYREAAPERGALVDRAVHWLWLICRTWRRPLAPPQEVRA